jgi:ubiquinone biosynthesis protein
MKKYLTRAVRGELEVRVRGLEEGGRTLYVVGRQVIYTTIGVAAGFAGLELDGRGQHGPARVLYWVAVGAGVLLLLSSVFSRPRSKRG